MKQGCPCSARRSTQYAARVKFVKAAQRLGFSLDEVAGLLTLEDGTHCDEARQLGEQKLADLRRIERVLAALVRDCARHGTVSCPLSATLQQQ